MERSATVTAFNPAGVTTLFVAVPVVVSLLVANSDIPETVVVAVGVDKLPGPNIFYDTIITGSHEATNAIYICIKCYFTDSR